MASPFNMAMSAAQRDILSLCRVLNFIPTAQQAEYLKEIQRQTYLPRHLASKGIACKSGQGPGKTKASVVAAQWRTIQAVNEQTLVTAPTMRQVKDVWMSELRKTIGGAHPDYAKCWSLDSAKAEFLGMQDWKIGTATSTKPENLQGYHSRGLTIVMDEASGIARPIWQTVKGTSTGPHNLILPIGNPNDRDSEFFDLFNKDSANYVLFTWSAEDSPNVSKKHIREMELEYGRDSDVFRVRVLGEFPRENPNSVVRYEDLLFCSSQVSSTQMMVAPCPTDDSPGVNVRQIGIDLARFGSDESVIVARYNSAVVALAIYVKEEPQVVLAKAMEMQRQLRWTDEGTTYCVDAGGMGQGAMYTLYEAGKDVFEFNSNATAFESLEYADAITEAYFTLRKLTRRRSIYLKRDTLMFSQLTGRQYFYKGGKFEVESKDDYLTRVGTEESTSPDRSDALALAFYPYASGRMVSASVEEERRRSR